MKSTVPMDSQPPTPQGPTPQLPSSDGSGGGSISMSSLLSIAQAVVLLALTILVIKLWYRNERQSPNGPVQPREIVARGDLAEDEQSTIELFRSASSSVVYVTTSTVARDFRFNIFEIPQGAGSGFIWDQQGHIVTNYHVVADSRRIRVTLSDQSSWNAELVGQAPDKDLAVLRIDAPRDVLAAIPVGSSRQLAVGQKVFAIGNPFGLDQTLTTGVISGLERQINAKTGRKINGVIQTDAAINPGNSGGPLLDSAGRLIGVNTAIFSPSGASAGIGFAIPVDAVNSIVPQLIQHGQLIRPGFGVRIAGDAFASQLQLNGVLVIEVPSGSAGANAGLEGVKQDVNGDPVFGDIITHVGGEPVTSGEDLFRVLEGHKVGETVSVHVIRNAQTSAETELDLDILLQALNE